MTVNQPTQTKTVRARILDVLEHATRPLSGMEVAKAAGLKYKTTIDGLNALLNYERVTRTGRKCVAKWSSNKPKVDPLAPLQEAIKGMTKAKPDV